MGNPKPKDGTKNLTPWKKGESGNPGGRPKVDPILLKARALSKQSIKKICDALLSSDIEVFEDIIQHGNALEMWLAGIILKGIKRSDIYVLTELLPWLIGKPPEEIQITTLRKVLRLKDGTEIVYTNAEVNDENHS